MKSYKLASEGFGIFKGRVGSSSATLPCRSGWERWERWEHWEHWEWPERNLPPIWLLLTFSFSRCQSPAVELLLQTSFNLLLITPVTPAPITVVGQPHISILSPVFAAKLAAELKAVLCLSVFTGMWEGKQGGVNVLSKGCGH